MQYNQFSQQQQQQPNQVTASQPQSDQQSFHRHDKDKDEDEDDAVLIPTSKKTNGARLKKMSKKNKEKELQVERTRARNLWIQGEELLLAKSFIQISEDPKTCSDQKNDTFWYKMDIYNEKAKRDNYPTHTKNLSTGKWIPMNRDVQKFNLLVQETLVMSEENDEYWMTRVKILYETHMGSDFKHKST
ncbi:hypothetical protein Tco_1185662 [Tanacetum coccineum]